jgi:tRNA A58 N-methylase Trm61
MLRAVVRFLIQCLTGLPDNLIGNALLTRMLGYVKDEILKTRYGYYIHFKATSPIPTSIRKQAILGVYEKPYLSVLMKLIEPGDYVVDVGAHEGYVSLMMANKVGGEGRVFSIEPNPENLTYLNENVKIN